MIYLRSVAHFARLMGEFYLTLGEELARDVRGVVRQRNLSRSTRG